MQNIRAADIAPPLKIFLRAADFSTAGSVSLSDWLGVRHARLRRLFESVLSLFLKSELFFQ
jgi:hypothetical protein